MATRISRRALFRLRPSEMLSLISEKERSGENEGQPRRYIRPPGAIPQEAGFLSACSRCSKCVEACPDDVIKSLTAVAGIAEGTPFLKPEENPCRWCVDMPCIESCESGALSFPQEGSVPPIAKAVFDVNPDTGEPTFLGNLSGLGTGGATGGGGAPGPGGAAGSRARDHARRWYR